MRTFQEIGIVLFGEHWRAPLCNLLGVDDRTLRRWTMFGTAVPAGVWQQLSKSLEERRTQIDQLLQAVAKVNGIASQHLAKFGLKAPSYHDVFVARDPQGLPRLFFRRDGDPLIGLDVGALSQLRQMIDADNDETTSRQISGYIEEATKLGIGRPGM